MCVYSDRDHSLISRSTYLLSRCAGGPLITWFAYGPGSNNDYKHTVSLFLMLHIILYCTYMNPPRMGSGWGAFPFFFLEPTRNRGIERSGFGLTPSLYGARRKVEDLPQRKRDGAGGQWAEPRTRYAGDDDKTLKTAV